MAAAAVVVAVADTVAEAAEDMEEAEAEAADTVAAEEVGSTARPEAAAVAAPHRLEAEQRRAIAEARPLAQAPGLERAVPRVSRHDTVPRARPMRALHQWRVEA